MRNYNLVCFIHDHCLCVRVLWKYIIKYEAEPRSCIQDVSLLRVCSSRESMDAKILVVTKASGKIDIRVVELSFE